MVMDGAVDGKVDGYEHDMSLRRELTLLDQRGDQWCWGAGHVL